MNDRIRKHIAQHCARNGWPTDDATIIEVIQESEHILRKEIRQRRWWSEYQYVVEVAGMIIGYTYAEASGDTSISDCYEFDPSTICEMRPVEKTVIVFEPVDN